MNGSNKILIFVGLNARPLLEGRGKDNKLAEE